MNFSKVIAIDGPSGSGKSTLAKKLSEALQVTYIDTGAMFRCLALYFHQEKIDINNLSQIKTALSNLQMEYGGDDFLIKINGRNLTGEIR